MPLWTPSHPSHSLLLRDLVLGPYYWTERRYYNNAISSVPWCNKSCKKADMFFQRFSVKASLILTKYKPTGNAIRISCYENQGVHRFHQSTEVYSILIELLMPDWVQYFVLCCPLFLVLIDPDLIVYRYLKIQAIDESNGWQKWLGCRYTGNSLMKVSHPRACCWCVSASLNGLSTP